MHVQSTGGVAVDPEVRSQQIAHLAYAGDGSRSEVHYRTVDLDAHPVVEIVRESDRVVIVDEPTRELELHLGIFRAIIVRLWDNEGAEAGGVEYFVDGIFYDIEAVTLDVDGVCIGLNAQGGR